jgi:hypothetical protein
MRMRAKMLSGMTRRRLRLGLSLFFLALALPSALLVSQAYSQLKWEAFHQHRVMAEELALRIDRELQQRFNSEESRSFTDYSFLNVAGGAEVNFIQRSPLSTFPVQSELPGLIGYFQIDTAGNFTTPLLPQRLDSSMLYGISREERAGRQQLQAQLQDILSRNQLVSSAEQAARRARMAAETQRDVQRRKREERQPLRAIPEAESSALEPQLSMSPQAAMAPGATMESLESDARLEASSPTDDGISEEGLAASPPLKDEAKVMSQAAFDRLSKPKGISHEKRSPSQQSKLGRVEDLKLDSPYSSAAPSKKSRQLTKPAPARGMRKESNVLPHEDLSGFDELESEQPAAPVRITTFQSELDPFEMSLLDSGHFVLFRKVCRNGQRYIQGALIEREPFLRGLFEPLFRETAL